METIRFDAKKVHAYNETRKTAKEYFELIKPVLETYKGTVITSAGNIFKKFKDATEQQPESPQPFNGGWARIQWVTLKYDSYRNTIDIDISCYFGGDPDKNGVSRYSIYERTSYIEVARLENDKIAEVITPDLKLIDPDKEQKAVEEYNQAVELVRALYSKVRIRY